jgi:hypothetical protein
MKNAGVKQRDYDILHPLELGFQFLHMCRRLEDYFTSVPNCSIELRKFYLGGQDPYLKLKGQLESIGWQIMPACEGGNFYLTDMVFGTPPGENIPLHSDDYKKKLKKFADLTIFGFPIQLAWNSYFWMSKDDEEFRIYREKPSSRYLTPKASKRSAGLAFASCCAKPGDLVMYDPANFHEVIRTNSRSYRISAHSFISMQPSHHKAMFWT